MRRSAAVLSALLLTLVLPSPASAGSYTSGPFCYLTSDVRVANGTPTIVDGAGGGPCITTRLGPGGSRWGVAPPDGTPCSFQQYAQLSFVDNGNGTWTMSWQWPDGPAETVTGPADVGPPPTDLAFEVPFQGTFQGGSCQGSYGLPQVCEGLTAGVPNIFFDSVPWCPSLLPPAVIGGVTPAFLAPRIDDLLGLIKGQLYAGTVEAAPAERGVVNVPQCFWLEGTTVPDERWYQVFVPGPTNDPNVNLFYTLRVQVQFLSVTWNFDDGSSSTDPLPRDCQGWQLAAHRYQQISERPESPDARYHVTATLHYATHVYEFWADSRGPNSFDYAGPSFDITSPARAQYIGQIEGIPVNP